MPELSRVECGGIESWTCEITHFVRPATDADCRLILEMSFGFLTAFSDGFFFCDPSYARPGPGSELELVGLGYSDGFQKVCWCLSFYEHDYSHGN